MPDMVRGSNYMGGVDRAALAIRNIMDEEICAIIDQGVSEGVITEQRGEALKKQCRAYGERTAKGAFSLHDKLIAAAKKAGVDVPPRSDGTEEFIDAMRKIPTLRGGER